MEGNSDERSKKMKPHEWRQLIAFTLSYSLTGVGVTVLGSALPFLASAYNLTDDQLGLAFLVLSIGLILGNIGMYLLSIYLEKNESAKAKISKFADPYLSIWTAGILLTAICFALMGFQPILSYKAFLVLHLFLGFSVSLLELALNCAVAEYGDSGMALIFVHGGFGLGSVVTPFVYPFLAKKYGLSGPYFVFSIWSIIILCLGIGVILYNSTVARARKLENQPSAQELLPSKETIKVQDEEEPSVVPLQDYEADPMPLEEPKPVVQPNPASQQGFLILTKSLTFWIIMAKISAYVGCELILGGWVVTFLIDSGYKNEAKVTLTLFWLGILVGRIVFSGVLMQIASSIKKSTIVLFIVTLLGVIFPVLFFLFPGPPWCFIFLFCIGFVFAPIFPLVVSLAGESFKDNSACALTALFVFTNCGAAFFPWLAGILAEAMGLTKAIWLETVSGCIVLVSVVLYFLVNRSRMV
jgi:fucose permease